MATKNGAPALEFIREQLKKNPQMPFADVKAAAEKRGFTIYPLMYGRAMSLEGLVRPGARRRRRGGGGGGGGARAAATRPAGRVRARAEQQPMAGLDAVMAAMQKGQRCRSALQEIQRILQDVL